MTIIGKQLVEIDSKVARTAMLAVLDFEIEHFNAGVESFPEELALCAVEAANAVTLNDSDKAETILHFLKSGTPTKFKRNKDELIALRNAIAEDNTTHYQLEYNSDYLQFSHGTLFGAAALNELRNASAPEIKTVLTIHSHWEIPESYITIAYWHKDRPEILRILGNHSTAD